MKHAITIIGLLAVLAVASGAHAQETMTSEEVRVAVQQICPVSGLELGAHGPPVKVKIGQQEMFLCCESCQNLKVKPEHWATIHQNMATAQGVCVVMENELPKSPKWTIVNGRLLFVCCPPCIDKIEADPATHIQKVDEAYAAYVRNQQNQAP